MAEARKSYDVLSLIHVHMQDMNEAAYNHSSIYGHYSISFTFTVIRKVFVDTTVKTTKIATNRKFYIGILRFIY